MDSNETLELLRFAVLSGKISAVMPNGEVWDGSGDMPDLTQCYFLEKEVADFECKNGMLGAMN